MAYAQTLPPVARLARATQKIDGRNVWALSLDVRRGHHVDCSNLVLGSHRCCALDAS